MTVLLEYITILVTEHTKRLGRQSIIVGWVHFYPCPPLAMPLVQLLWIRTKYSNRAHSWQSLMTQCIKIYITGAWSVYTLNGHSVNYCGSYVSDPQHWLGALHWHHFTSHDIHGQQKALWKGKSVDISQWFLTHYT